MVQIRYHCSHSRQPTTDKPYAARLTYQSTPRPRIQAPPPFLIIAFHHTVLYLSTTRTTRTRTTLCELPADCGTNPIAQDGEREEDVGSAQAAGL